MTAYKDSLEERFSNTNIRDAVSRICSESSAKLPKFLIPTLKENLTQGGSIRFGTFILAAWCYYSDQGLDQNNEPIEIIDARKDELHLHAKQYEHDKLSFLCITDIFGDLKKDERFVGEYEKMTNWIYKEADIRKVMSQICFPDEA